jgi:hypothetical protein
MPITTQGTIANCQIISPHLIDCNHTSGNVALITLSGSGHAVRHVKVSNAGAPPYSLIAWFSSTASNCIVEVESAASGTGGRITDAGTGNAIVDQPALAWQAYTPTVTPGSGALTSATASGRFKRVGKTIYFSAHVAITTNGTGASLLKISLPIGAQAANNTFGCGREGSTGGLLQWFNADPANAYVVSNAGGYPGGDGRSIDISGSYEAA